jgi:hypothetical protein
MVAERVEADTFEVSPEVWWRAEFLQRGTEIDLVTALSWASRRNPDGGYTLDVHDTLFEYKSLIQKGCPHELAMRILAPDDDELANVERWRSNTSPEHSTTSELDPSTSAT